MNSQPTLGITEQAIARVSDLVAQKGTPDLYLRVFVKGGGCSGFQYGFEFESNRDPDDLVIEKGAINLLVDPLSLQYLAGAQIDYLEDLQGTRFVVSNPNASTTCGCGSSFSL